MNRVTLVGHVGADPESGTSEGGVEWAKFRIATTERWKDTQGQKKEETEWTTIVVWREGLVGVVKSYVKKGSQLYVDGRLRTRKWQDKDGQDRYTTEVVLQNMELLGRAPRENAPMDGPPESEQRHGGSGSSGGVVQMPPPSGGAYANGSHGGGIPGRDGGYSKSFDDEIPFSPEVR